MATLPEFPNFKPIELSDRDFIQDLLWAYQPSTSELTFSNMYIWWHFYRIRWAMYDQWLILLCDPRNQDPYFLPPVGPASRLKAVKTALQWLKNEGVEYPSIMRADEKLVSELIDFPQQHIESTRDHFDYVYQTQDLIQLSGRPYHKKKNHLNRFRKNYTFEYATMAEKWIPECIEVLKRWCDFRECEKNEIKRAEFESVHEALYNYKSLKMQGGLILIDGSLEAFTLGELLNKETAVIHVEKADPKIPELFTVINQQFCENALHNVPYVNREQDLGEEGLRRAKMSYHPVRLVEKYKVSYRD